MTLTLRHQVPLGIVAVAIPGQRPRTELIPLPVSEIILWLISNIWPQVVIIAASEALIGCGIIYERYWLGLPSLYAEAIEAVIETVSTGWGWV